MLQTSQLTSEVPQLPFVFWVVDAPVVQVVLAIPVVVNDRCASSDSAEHRRGPAVAVHQVRRHSLLWCKSWFHGPCDQGDSTVAVLSPVVDVPVGSLCRFFVIVC